MGRTPGYEPRDGRLPGRAAPQDEAAAPRRGRGRRAMERALEIALVLLLTLFGFLVVLVGLDRMFPSVTGLGQLLRTEGAGWDSRLSRTTLGAAPSAADDRSDWAVAVLGVLDNQVMRKTSGSVAWDPVRDGVHVRQGDGVQTTREGMAVVEFDREDWLRIGRNSLVILRHPDEEDAGPRTVSLSVVSGEVWGRFSGRRGGSVRVEVAGGGSVARLAAEPRHRAPSRFKVTVRRDHSASIAVYAGRTTVTLGERTVHLGPNQYVVVRRGAFAGVVRTLPAAPRVASPEDGRSCRFREFPPTVVFRWGGTDGAELQRLLVARDPAFREVVFDETVDGDSLALGSLPPGEYHWRVSAQRAGVEGAPSAARRLSLVLDDVAPALRVDFPEGTVAGDLGRVEGATEPGSRLFVAGRQVPAGDDGRFRFDTPLRPGTNLVVVEAVDAAGNSTYRSQVVRRAVQH
jgi:hypothetical protein